MAKLTNEEIIASLIYFVPFEFKENFNLFVDKLYEVVYNRYY